MKFKLIITVNNYKLTKAVSPKAESVAQKALCEKQACGSGCA